MGRRLLQLVFLITFILITSNSARPSDHNNPVVIYNISVDPGKDSIDMLSGISAKIKDQSIYLNWRITSPKDISYFDIQRLDPSGKEYKTLKKNKKVKWDDFYEKSSDGNGLRVLKYNYEDEPDRDGVYFYRIRAFNESSELMFTSDDIKIGISGLKNFKLEQNFPNPFNPTTSITYDVYEDASIKLKVFDIIGREVTTLVDKFQTTGTYTVEFDASKFSNLTSGIYFYMLATEKFSEVKKMILTK